MDFSTIKRDTSKNRQLEAHPKGGRSLGPHWQNWPLIVGSRGTLKLPKRAQAHFHSHVAMPCMKSEYWLKGSLWTEMPSTGYSHMSKPHKLMLLRSKHMYGCETHRRLIRNSFTCPKDSCRRCRSRPPLLLPSSSLRSQSADHVPASKFQSAKPDAMPKKPCAS